MEIVSINKQIDFLFSKGVNFRAGPQIQAGPSSSLQEKPFLELTVSTLEDGIPLFINYLKYQIANFSAGCIRDRLNAWENPPSDIETLTIVQGLPLEFEQEPFIDTTSS